MRRGRGCAWQSCSIARCSGSWRHPAATKRSCHQTRGRRVTWPRSPSDANLPLASSINGITASMAMRIRSRARLRKRSIWGSDICVSRWKAVRTSCSPSQGVSSADPIERKSRAASSAFTKAHGLMSQPHASRSASRSARTRNPLPQPASRKVRAEGNCERRNAAVSPKSPLNSSQVYPRFQLLFRPCSK